MHRSLSTRGRFFIAAIAFALISLLLALFVPLTYSETKYFELDVAHWHIPFKNYVLFASALGCIILLLIVLGMKRHISTYILATCLGVAALFIGYMSFLSLTTIDEEAIYIKDVFDEHTYHWHDMTNITLLYDEQDFSEQYIITLADGSTVHIDKTAQFEQASSFIYSTARANDIPFQEERK